MVKDFFVVALLASTAFANHPSADCSTVFCSNSSIAPAHHTDWMKHIEDTRPLAWVSLPGTHDTAASVNGGIGLHTQALNFKQQLEFGLRYVDARLQVLPDQPDTLGFFHNQAY